MKYAFATLCLVGATFASAIAEPAANAEAKLVRNGGKNGFCGPRGVSCARSVDPEIEARDAEPKLVRGGGKNGFCGPRGVSCARSVATCGIPGSPCARLKRSADAVAEAFALAEDHTKRGVCGAPGVACHRARRSILEVGDAVEEAVTSIYAREADAEAGLVRGKGRNGFCGPRGVSCARRVKRDAVTEAHANAEAVKLVRGKNGFCGPRGVSCAKTKRDAEAGLVRGKGRNGFCGPRGVSCAKVKRDAEADAEAVAEAGLVRGKGRNGFCGPRGVSCAKAKRDAEADAEADADAIKLVRQGKGFCGPRGVSCAKVKRDEEDDEILEVRDAAADPVRLVRGKNGFCGPRGVSCAKAKRDADAEAEAISEEQANLARSIDAAEPEFFKRVRDADNGEGTALREAHAAFMSIKRDAEAITEDTTPFELLSICEDYDCDEETVSTIAARAMGQFDEREAEACNAPGGACDIAKRQLADIEAKLTAAVEAL